MRRTQIVFGVILALAAVLVLVLALRNPPAPFLPVDDDHVVGPDLSSCIDCHDPDGAAPRGKTHPLGNDCFRCHSSR